MSNDYSVSAWGYVAGATCPNWRMQCQRCGQVAPFETFFKHASKGGGCPSENCSAVAHPLDMVAGDADCKLYLSFSNDNETEFRIYPKSDDAVIIFVGVSPEDNQRARFQQGTWSQNPMDMVDAVIQGKPRSEHHQTEKIKEIAHNFGQTLALDN